jgi:hypothetical protein
MGGGYHGQTLAGRTPRDLYIDVKSAAPLPEVSSVEWEMVAAARRKAMWCNMGATVLWGVSFIPTPAGLVVRGINVAKTAVTATRTAGTAELVLCWN